MGNKRIQPRCQMTAGGDNIARVSWGASSRMRFEAVNLHESIACFKTAVGGVWPRRCFERLGLQEDCWRLVDDLL